VAETPEIRELNVLDFTCVATDCFVEIDDLGVRNGKGAEKLKDVFGITLQLIGSVEKSAEDGCGGGIPGNSPVAVGLDGFGWFATADGKVKIPNGGGDLVFGETGEKAGEDSVKVDRCSGENMVPFGLWERGKRFSGLE